MQFVADKMVGRLARWLRIIGQDVTYGPDLCGAGLIRAARRDNRIILTRDRRIGRKNPPPYLLIRSDRFREQLRQVIEEFSLDPLKDAFTRCVECNTRFEPTAKGEVKGKVPPYVFNTQEKFSFCRECRRFYWPATHQEKMLEELRSLEEKSPGI
jgi:uncharacterized protein with PIN domain